MNGNESLSQEEAAQAFAAIGSEPRLAVLLCLVRAGEGGLTVGEIGGRLAMPASTLAHHLRFLVAGGVVEQQRDGRAVVNRAAFNRVRDLANYLVDECCADVPAANDEEACVHEGAVS